MAGPLVVRAAGSDGFELQLDRDERDLLRMLVGEIRAVLLRQDVAGDAALGRLFPPAYPDDLLRNLDYERGAGNDLLAGRLEALDRVEAAAEAPAVDEETLMALMRTVNDVRLLYGTRLDLTEDSGPQNFPDEPQRGMYRLYVWLSSLMEDILSALDVR
jgi:hypothetical protein